VLESASVEHSIGVTSEVWDWRDFFLGTPHDSIKISTGGTVKSIPDNLITKSTGVGIYGNCKRWQLFIEEITQGDPDLALYLPKVGGYCPTGFIREQALFFLYGPGGNSQSVLLKRWRTLSVIMRSSYPLKPSLLAALIDTRQSLRVWRARALSMPQKPKTGENRMQPVSNRLQVATRLPHASYAKIF